MHMKPHFENIKTYKHATPYVQVPNQLITDIAEMVKDAGGDVRHTSSCYGYMVCLGFLFKYAHYVDFDGRTYIQNTDIKQILGYSKQTKGINKYIKTGGLLDEYGFSRTSTDYPVSAEYDQLDKTDGLATPQFEYASDLYPEGELAKLKDEIVKNYNFEARIPNYLFEYDGEDGTLTNYERTHRITLTEFLYFMDDDDFTPVHFYLYAYLKAKCAWFPKQERALTLAHILKDLNCTQNTFYPRVNELAERGLVKLNRAQWEQMEGNEYVPRFTRYTFVGVEPKPKRRKKSPSAG